MCAFNCKNEDDEDPKNFKNFFVLHHSNISKEKMKR